jgi:hypothetical protein
MRRPLFPRKQTWIGPARAGKLGEFQRFSPGGLFGLSFNFLRMNQAHRSGADNGRDLTTPHPRAVFAGQNQISTLATAMSALSADGIDAVAPK